MKTEIQNGVARLRATKERRLVSCFLRPVAVRSQGMLMLCVALLLAAPQALCAEVTLLKTILNPAPGFYADYFGWSVAVVGSDRVLIGAPYDDWPAYDAGAAYLFGTNGTLLTPITNPLWSTNDYFGHSVAAVGNDKVLVGAVTASTGAGQAGAAYLFDTSGNPLTTFTNPTPNLNDYFGWSVAAVGHDRVLVSAIWDDTGATDTGSAYLFTTGGTLLTTLTNPTPAYQDEFGYSVAAIGADRLLIGARGDSRGAAYAGVAYLFSTNGTLLTTFTNPTPQSFDNFGTSVAAVGNDRLIVGAPSDNTGATDAGAAYLFSTNGTLLTTFTNPTPAYQDSFGISVAAAGTDQVLIGAHRDDTGAIDAGAAYLFTTSGTLVKTITNPAPEAYDWFGFSVAASSDLVLIGAYADSTGTASAGAAHLYSLKAPGAPLLSIARTTTNTVAVYWPSPSTGWSLQQNTNDVSSANWSNATTGLQDDGTTKSLMVNPPTGNRFYRLYKP